MNEIDSTYFDRQIYALYRAVWERWGDEAWYVVWRSGEVLYDEIEPELGLRPDDGPVSALQRLGDYLRRVGYVEGISVKPLSDEEWEYRMQNPVILPGAARLIADGAVPAHISTTLMFALLKKRYAMEAQMVGDPEFRADGWAIERWQLVASKTT